MTRENGVSPATGLRYTRRYPKESIDKRAARLYLYKFATQGFKTGHAITLAGTEPFAEVALMRDYLKWPASKTWFVDWARNAENRPEVLEALRNIKASWPTANVLRDDIVRVVEGLPVIGFANLDFMSFMDRDSMQPTVRMTIEKLAPGGIMGLTWFRGREVDAPERSAYDVFEYARDVGDKNQRRWVGVMRMVNTWARQANVTLEVLGALEYQHNRSPMSVTVWRRV